MKESTHWRIALSGSISLLRVEPQNPLAGKATHLTRMRGRVSFTRQSYIRPSLLEGRTTLHLYLLHGVV